MSGTTPTHILLIDDELNLLESLKDALEAVDAPWHVKAVSNAEHARAMLQQQRFDLAICDIRMPGMSGLRFLTEVAPTHKGLRVIMMTAYGSNTIRQATLKHGAVGYIEKPFELDDFVALVREYTHDSGFSGAGVAGFRLIDCLQLVGTSGLSTKLHIRAPGQGEAHVIFDRGQLVHAEIVGGISGEEAFYQAVTWTSGDLASTPMNAADLQHAPHTIERPLIHLMMEAMRLLDERNPTALQDDDGDWSWGLEQDDISAVPPSPQASVTPVMPVHAVARPQSPPPAAATPPASPSNEGSLFPLPRPLAASPERGAPEPPSPTPGNADTSNDEDEDAPPQPRDTLKMDRKRLIQVLNDIEDEAMGGLLATDIWKKSTAMPIAGINSKPKATALFNRLSELILRTLSGAEGAFSSSMKQYMVEMNDGTIVFVVELSEEYRWGMLIDSSKAPVGLMLSVILPEAMEQLRDALNA